MSASVMGLWIEITKLAKAGFAESVSLCDGAVD